jgi:heme-degrading monooxygenase HmoA
MTHDKGDAMPALPWVERQPIDPSATYVAMASRLPLVAYHSIPGFLWRTMLIRRQLSTAPGLIGYGLDAQLSRRTFWTFSIWDSNESLETFAGTDPHRRLTMELRGQMQETRFERFRIGGHELPLPRREIRERVG